MDTIAPLFRPDRVAVFVDGENLSACHASEIGERARDFGLPDTRRVYGDASLLSGWCSAPGFRVIHSGTGKNAADLLLCIEAMEICLPGTYGTALVASSDGDFVHLAQRLRDLGMRVVGAGLHQAPGAFRAACSEFIDLGASVAPVDRRDEIDRRCKDILGEEWMKLVAFGHAVSAAHGKALPKPAAKWSTYFRDRPNLYELRGEKAGLEVRAR